jgi:hypothetical protein
MLHLLVLFSKLACKEFLKYLYNLGNKELYI